MAIVGLIPFVYAAIKKKRKSTARAADRYVGLAGGGAARGHDHARAAYQSQSCYFAVRPSPLDELGFMSEEYGAARRPPPKEKDLSRSRELFHADGDKCATSVAPASGRGNARPDGGHQFQSCRFAVRPPSPVDDLLASRDDGASRRPIEDLLRQLLLPASRRDSLAPGAARGREHARSNGSAYQSQSCRFVVHRSVAYELGLSHEDEYSAASTSPEDVSGKLLYPAGRRENGLSRSLRFSTMPVFAWVSGA